jgi:ABC-type Fe3+ transport system permease subunit
MNQDQTDQPKHPDLTVINQAVQERLRSHQQKVRWLAGAAFLLGVLAIAASFLVVTGYFVFYRPKEKEVLRQVTLAAERAKTQTPAENAGPHEPKLPFDFPSVQATMTFLHSVAIAFLAAAIGILALGTLVLLAVVMLNRRVTLRQINASLAQISSQLKEIELKTAQR